VKTPIYIASGTGVGPGSGFAGVCPSALTLVRYGESGRVTQMQPRFAFCHKRVCMVKKAARLCATSHNRLPGYDRHWIVSDITDRFGGLEVACWPLIPKFAGSNPAEAVGFFRAKKILSKPSFGGEIKPSVPCRRFTACKRSLNATWKSGISGKIHRPFLAHKIPLLATRISGETTSGERWNV
jgi:hypothetical protein